MESINGDPQKRDEAVRHLRSKVLDTPELQIQTDDAYLLKFLRACCFNVNEAFDLIMKYFEMKADNKNKKLFTDVRPSAVKHVLEAGVTGTMKNRDKLGREVFVFRPGLWDTSKYEKFDVFKTNFMTLYKMTESEETQMSGISVIVDMNNLGFGQLTHLNPPFIKRAIGLFQRNVPARIMSIHYVNEPLVFDFIFAIAKPFLNEDTIAKIHVHGHNFDELLDYFYAEYLPEEYGGKAPPYSTEESARTLLECDALFDAEAKNVLVPTGSKASKD